MATSKDYLEYVLDLFDGLNIRYKYMFSEYMLYYKDKVIGGIFDNQLLLKPTKSVLKYLNEPTFLLPFKGAKNEMVLFDKEDKELLSMIVIAMVDELPNPKKKLKNSKNCISN
ncbi:MULTISPECIES: hypothetical protein [unclassified Campylobacter]|uniref:TfoX/Sxy family protein n=1 Tax=unclassified Campylobacter TaxID=2593542 RepID=UPI001EFB0F9B|nr:MULTISPECIES: hypothetical protein [unclassified Campylobacter]ULO02977.1 TfoX domain-containing protein [Campylobacter sp. RM12651]